MSSGLLFIEYSLIPLESFKRSNMPDSIYQLLLRQSIRMSNSFDDRFSFSDDFHNKTKLL